MEELMKELIVVLRDLNGAIHAIAIAVCLMLVFKNMSANVHYDKR